MQYTLENLESSNSRKDRVIAENNNEYVSVG